MNKIGLDMNISPRTIRDIWNDMTWVDVTWAYRDHAGNAIDKQLHDWAVQPLPSDRAAFEAYDDDKELY